MSDDNHVLDLLPAYALGCLEKAEARMVAGHLAGCPACRAELNALQESVDQLALSAPDASPPPRLKHRLMDRVRSPRPAALPQTQTPQARFLRRSLPIWGAVCLLLILALTLAGLRLWRQTNRSEAIIGPNGMWAVALHSTDAAPESSGFVVISQDGLTGSLVVDRLPRLGAEQQYQLWLIRDGQMTSGAVFSVDERGYRGARIVAPESLLAYSEICVTIEPHGGSPRPTGAHVLNGPLLNP